ncbi:Iron-regulated ABC transporter ATPase subunit SufC [Marinitoga hydrogenitolerans DSM 16785]|uniref:Iron-regulated ABC transporter ATPase subunit SufC n=1 Tax=Marinitoga hydrogenitolerans (strain DSM 16785 / JCM 12826 / AT1271) TaxID=1122195 RepID=A0A1M4UDC2_MARH1|nr:ATP-binding cassette domain-containing protein [Marinitoga hydrogenitolerans]SHE54607.1 Iron-regulated ABC transporter ATPase subunit SufC [Marinitoga hydrogenitolerans DSM 16785]
MLELKNISFKTGTRKILEDISYKFEDGKIYAVLGNNGVGKSTLARIIMGLNGYIGKHGGQIIFNGKDITNLNITERAKLRITMAWQEPVRYEGLGVREYLTLGKRINLSDSELIEILNLVGLNPFYLHRKVDKTLSGGERKRIELASLIILKPRFAIFDEPDSGIDMMSNIMIERIFKIITSTGGTVLSITHREEIAEIADEAFLICSGKIKAEGDPKKVSEVYKSTCDNCAHINVPVEFTEDEVKL